MRRPNPLEHASYYRGYVDRVPEGCVVEQLAAQVEVTNALLADLDDEQALFRYAPDKWSLKELLGHVVDTERIFQVRLLRIVRGDETPLPGFEQDPYIESAGFDRRPMAELLEEYGAVRAATLTLLRSVEPEDADRSAVVSGAPMVACTIPWILAGHELHHVDVVRERYLPALGVRTGR